MVGIQVDVTALQGRGAQVSSIGKGVLGLAGAAGSVPVGDVPPKTKAALDSALSAWPAAIRRLGGALQDTGAALGKAAGTYSITDQGIARVAEQGGAK